MSPPERSQERDSAIEAVLPFVPELGWTRAALEKAGGADAALLFPGGGAEMVEAFIGLADRRMVEEAAPLLAGERLPGRVRVLIETRLRQSEPHREAIRRALALLAPPRHAALATRCTLRTVDAIWHAAGDRSADFSWYSKRAILAGVYSSTLLFWLNPRTDREAALAFLDRRLGDVAGIGRLRARLGRTRTTAPHSAGQTHPIG